MNIFHGYLEAIETSCLSDLNFLWKSLNQVFIYNAIWSRKESKDMLDEMSLTIF